MSSHDMHVFVCETTHKKTFHSHLECFYHGFSKFSMMAEVYENLMTWKFYLDGSDIKNSVNFEFNCMQFTTVYFQWNLHSWVLVVIRFCRK